MIGPSYGPQGAPPFLGGADRARRLRLTPEAEDGGVSVRRLLHLAGHRLSYFFFLFALLLFCFFRFVPYIISFCFLSSPSCGFLCWPLCSSFMVRTAVIKADRINRFVSETMSTVRVGFGVAFPVRVFSSRVRLLGRTGRHLESR